MSIAIVMPRRMNFSPLSATSIDLCVHDYILASRYRADITVYAMPVERPYDDVKTVIFADYSDLVCKLKQQSPRLIFAQQHLPTATRLARAFPRTPVVLQAHNYQKQPSNWLKRCYKTRAYNSLAGMVMVSRSLAERFAVTYPKVQIPVTVAPNGLELADWHPNPQRVQEILFVGRLNEDKGVFQAAAAMAALLPQRPEWRARFIVSTKDNVPGARDRLTALLHPLGAQTILDFDLPFAAVKAAMESAAIALVPSIFDEPFGRTAIEAFAGGAALVASTRGGLAEVIGDAAVPLAGDITAETIAKAVLPLLGDAALRERLAAAGRARVAANFTIQHNAAALDAALATHLI